MQYVYVYVYVYMYTQIDTIWAADMYGIYKASRCKPHTDRTRILYRT